MAYVEVGRDWFEDPRDHYEDEPVLTTEERAMQERAKYEDACIKASRSYHQVFRKEPGEKGGKKVDVVATAAEILGIDPHKWVDDYDDLDENGRPKRKRLIDIYAKFAYKKSRKKGTTSDVQLLEVFGWEGTGFKAALVHDEAGYHVDPARLQEVAVLDATYGPDGNRLIQVSADGTVYMPPKHHGFGIDE